MFLWKVIKNHFRKKNKNQIKFVETKQNTFKNNSSTALINLF